MTCPGTGPGIVTNNWLFQNYVRTNPKLVPTVFNPTNVGEVVSAVQAAESAGGFLKAVGSGWSYGDVAVDPTTTHVINTALLKKILSGTGGRSPRPLNPKFPAAKLVPYVLKDTLQPTKRFYVHVEAGITLWDLNCNLDAMRDSFNIGLAMATLGGNNGQSLAGAISTGTHGTHVDLPPIADSVEAMHLVGPGGQEWWIEREGANSITEPTRIAQAQQAGVLCNDIKVIYDDGLFRAALVSMGRMGVFYSYVLKVVGAYKLHKMGKASTWSIEQNTVRKIQATDPLIGYKDPWVEILVDPYPDANGDHACVVTTSDSAALQATNTIGPPSADPCGTKALVPLLSAHMALLPVEIGIAAQLAVAGLSPLLLIPFVGPAIYAVAASSAVTTATAALLALEIALGQFLLNSAEDTPGQGIANLCNVLIAAGHKELIPPVVWTIMSTVRSPTADELAESFRIMTGQNACPGARPGDFDNLCTRQIDGAEFAFDLSPGKSNLFDFVSQVFSMTQDFYNANTPVGFAMSLRFTTKTKAMLGMQQFSRTCSVEVDMLRGMGKQDFFLEQLYQVALSNGGIPHWGLMNDLTEPEVRMLYSELTGWQVALSDLITWGGGRAATFRSAFSLQRGLEPSAHALPWRLRNLIDRLRLKLQSLGARANSFKPPRPG